jgi:cytochrome c biogenesis protein CcmG/thiol:disulfide interchange protein DsbE
MKRLGFLLPLIVLAALGGYFTKGLYDAGRKNPNELPSVLLDQPVPEFALQAIRGRDRGLSSADLKGEVSLVNIFGSWCIACRQEHPVLMGIRKKNLVPIHGIDWREEDREAGPKWLKRFGDPYTLIGDDPRSVAAIAFGVTGAPETFLIDHRGIIRLKKIGPISTEYWENKLWPLIKQLREQ